ncbi:AMP-binding protein [Chromobacterium sp. S0633]|uniref:AMP-binding protein n=1 Tax=unclassified Chromobacterium TaxID=2641838 RepID=UPI000D31646A|nr:MULTISPECIES: AMP-binding protein [unclassified Chromobacterium]MCP1292363.1 AMP-binding protein [Chromobacterium sp. S0633]PTU65873.1 AMP-binding protein [Chromobacterium sp. Panama]
MTLPSYVHGASPQALIGQTIGQLFDQTCREHGRREALVVRHQQIRWSYEELREQVDRLACGLIRLGLKPGDRIGIWSQNNAEWVLTQFATAKAGLIMVNINPAYRRSELEYALSKVGCRALILSPSFKSSDYLAMAADLLPELAASEPGRLKSAAMPQLEIVIRLGRQRTPGMFNFADLMAAPSAEEKAGLQRLGETLQFDDVINIQFTSGTTGSPKGATLTHHNILNNAYFAGAAMAFGPDDRLCIPVPLYHCFGMVLGTLLCLSHGAAMVFPAESFDAQEVLRTVQEEGCTGLHGVPTMFISVLDRPDFSDYDVSTLRTGIMAGSPCPIEVMKRVTSQLNMSQVTIGYGMTETSPLSFQSATDTPLDKRVATVGRIHPHVEVKIVDVEGRITPRGQSGELCTRGYSVMPGYWGDPAKTAEAIDAAGWMRTGDLAEMDADGYVNIVGRVKDMVIRGGENIYPREVEEFLYRHPKIQDVQVIGVPDERFGEELCAWIRLRDGESADADDIRAFCQGQIAHYKIPRYIEFVDSFPMTITGKIQKFVMREKMKEKLGLADGKTA